MSETRRGRRCRHGCRQGRDPERGREGGREGGKQIYTFFGWGNLPAARGDCRVGEELFTSNSNGLSAEHIPKQVSSKTLSCIHLYAGFSPNYTKSILGLNETQATG